MNGESNVIVIELVLFFGGVMAFCIAVLVHQWWEERRDRARAATTTATTTATKTTATTTATTTTATTEPPAPHEPQP